MIDSKTQEKLKEIKRSFRLLMNGAASKSMRDKGIDYHLNWGVSFTDLKKMATEYGEDYHLAVELWKENIRECKILATLMMPHHMMPPDLAELWMEQTPTQEIAEMLAFNLFQYLDYAPAMAYEWISHANPLYQICGYQILSRWISKYGAPDDRGLCELIDQAHAALSDESLAVRHAAYNCLLRLASVGEEYARIVNTAIRDVGIGVSL